jgi:hypothetical protein
MRHSSITLTMDAYGHLLPDQHADAIGGMVKMLADQTALAATGTAGPAPAVGSAVGTQNGASACDDVRQSDDGNDDRNTPDFPVQNDVQSVKKGIGPARIRTENQGIMSPLL